MAQKETLKNQQKKSFAKSVKAEWKKVVWPTPKEVLNYGIVVTVVCLIIVAFVFGLDSIFHFLYGLISK
ncbi:preprotein translocase subunit SecE [Miniphocaeibacter massiliensis]|uniref:preprotein translocase subunit SecE n=1 Tax=Miniphocaeibacter massiliensis TaxID=2041841 RepID=UPI000C06A7D5|nr:preprotein translocase subunit SecE [Miniphocaeibacter massiliensis]